MRIEPAPSVPSAATPIPVATAAAAPPLDPPALRAVSHGFAAGGPTGFTVPAVQPNSEVVVLPISTAPAARSRAAAGASESGTQAAYRELPRVVRTPAVGTR